MASVTISPTLESIDTNVTRVPPPALGPAISPGTALSEAEKEKHAESMTDEELAGYVENKLKPLGETLRRNIAYIREARDRFAHPGRRVPVPGQPTFTQWIKQNLGISDRHVRRLLAAAKESTDHNDDEDMEQSPKQERRDEALWQAGRIAHAVLGLDQADEHDPSGLTRKSSLTALAHEFLNMARHKHIPVVVRLKELQPGDFRGLYAILSRCLSTQLDEVFASLDEQERSDSLRLLAREISNRYNRVNINQSLEPAPATLILSVEACLDR
jgi:hypothetical protein